MPIIGVRYPPILGFGGSSPGHADAIAIIGNEGACFKLMAMRNNQCARTIREGRRRPRPQAQNAGMFRIVTEDQRAKVDIDRDQRPSLGKGGLEYRRIARVGASLHDAGDIVAVGTKAIGDRPGDAVIEQELPLLHWPPPPPHRTCASCRKACRRKATPP